MKRILTISAFVAASMALNAQNTVKRVPVYEVFSSSTCGPCRPGNQHLTPQFEARDGKIVVVKYQMNWPGAGDPYYTSAGNSRRGYYGVTGIPDFYDNAEEMYYADFDTTVIDAELQEDVQMKMDLRYMVDLESHTVAVRSRIEALGDYDAGAHRVYIAIIEKVTHKNKESNGETEFHNVFKKMLPTDQGDFLVGALAAGDTITYDLNYEFKGNYRLPQNSSDKINDESENSVEDYENLHVVMFMQSASGAKEIYQGAVGEHSKSIEDFYRPWGAWATGVEEVASNDVLRVYPNPAKSNFVTVASNDSKSFSEVAIYNIAGELIDAQVFNQVNQAQLNVEALSTGMYILKIKTENGLVSQQLSVLK